VKRDPQQELVRRAKRYANPKCKKCFGRGTEGRDILLDGSTRLIICKCAYNGFPELQRSIDGKRNLSPRP
jgi:hypothetical protein